MKGSSQFKPNTQSENKGEMIKKRKEVFCYERRECWAGKNNRCSWEMKWGWPEGAYAVQKNSKHRGQGWARA